MIKHGVHNQTDCSWQTGERAAELIKICADANFMLRGLGIAVKPRVLSDLHSGQTDRVVAEWELEDLSETMAVEGERDEDVDSQDEYEDWFERLSEIIDYAEVEMWQTH